MDNSVYIERFKVIAHSKCFILPCSVIYRVKHFYLFIFFTFIEKKNQSSNDLLLCSAKKQCHTGLEQHDKRLILGVKYTFKYRIKDNNRY